MSAARFAALTVSREPAPLPEDRVLVERIRQSDEQAFEVVFRTHYNGLCMFVARMLQSDAAAEEVVQETLLRVWAQRASLSVSESLAGYLYGAARNRALIALRRQRLERRHADSAAQDDAGVMGRPSPEADAHVYSAELAQAIEQVIAALPARCREAYLLRRQHGLSYVEIARIMGVAPKTVEVQIGAALRQLRARLVPFK